MFIVALALVGGVLAAVIAMIRTPQLPRAWPLLAIAAVPAGALLLGIQHMLLCLVAIMSLVLWGWRNWRLAGTPLLSAGALLNLLAMAYHNGAMPILDTTLRAVGQTAPVGDLLLGSKDIVIATSPVALLSDWIILSLGADRWVIASPGDLLLVAGILWWLWFSGAAQRGTHDIRSTTVLSHRHSAPTARGTQPASGPDQAGSAGGG